MLEEMQIKLLPIPMTPATPSCTDPTSAVPRVKTFSQDYRDSTSRLISLSSIFLSMTLRMISLIPRTEYNTL